MQYPIKYQFKLLALSSQIFIRNDNAQDIMYVKQKMFKLKEDIEVFRDSSKTELLYRIKADRVIDFSPRLAILDAAGRELGSIKRHGRRSLWRANYDIEINGAPFANIQEKNPWAKLGDALFSQLPFIGILAGYVFHLKYAVRTTNAQEIAEIRKLPAFFEGKYTLESMQLANLPEEQQQLASVAFMVVILFERTRG